MWKRRVNKYIKEKQRRELLNDVKNYKKLNHQEMSKETFEQKPFLRSLSLENSRMKYKVISNVIPTVRSHFSRKYRPRSLTCPGCTPTHVPNNQEVPKDTTEHILLTCDAYSDLKDEEFDHNNDRMLAEFFRKVVQRRLEEGED